MKRPLTEEERTHSLKAVERLEREETRFDYANQRIKLQLDIGLDITRWDLEKEHKHNSKEIEEIREKINDLKNMVVNGVEVKEITEVKEEIKKNE